MTDHELPTTNGDLAVKIRRLTKLLETVVPRLEVVEELQAITVGEQTNQNEALARLADRLRLLVNQRCTCLQRPVMADDTFANSTLHEEPNDWPR